MVANLADLETRLEFADDRLPALDRPRHGRRAAGNEARTLWNGPVTRHGGRMPG